MGAEMNFSVTLPWPDPALNPNRKNGKRWTSVHALKVRAKTDAHYLTMAAMADLGIPDLGAQIPLTLTFHAPDRRARDADNLLAQSKALLDGFANALGVDDSRFEPITIRRVIGKKPGALVVEVGHG
jgi:crossover junction endodeoxyribonuclease RusA